MAEYENNEVMKNKHFIFAYIFGAFIVIGSFLPTEKLEKVQESNVFLGIILSDYSFHFFTFVIFTALLCYGFYGGRNRSFSFFKIGVISLSFGLLIEFYQILLPNRNFVPKDLIFNFAGIIAALILYKIFIIYKYSQNAK